MSDLAALLERAEEAAGPDRELDADLWWEFNREAASVAYWNASMGPPRLPAPEIMKPGMGRTGVRTCSPRFTGSIDAAIALLETVLPGWWWTAGSCALTNDASVAIPGSSGIGLGHALHAVVGPDFRVSEEMKTLLRERPDLDGGIDVDRVGGNVPLSIIEAVLTALIALRREAA